MVKEEFEEHKKRINFSVCTAKKVGVTGFEKWSVSSAAQFYA